MTAAKPPTPAQVSREMRRDICAYVLASTGVTVNGVSDNFNVSKTTARLHLSEIEILGTIKRVMQVSTPGRFVIMFYSDDYGAPDRPANADEIISKYVIEKIGDSRRIKTAPAVQLGMVRDPLLAVLFGACGVPA